MFILLLWTELKDKHCRYHYDCDYDFDSDKKIRYMPPPLVFRMMQGLDAEFLPCKHYMPNGFSVFFLYYPALQASLKDLRYQPRNVLLVCRMMRGLDAGE